MWRTLLTAAILKMQECVSRRGEVGRANGAPQVKPRVIAPAECDAARMGAGCPAYGSLRSPDVQDTGDVTFFNRADRAVNIKWIDY